MKPGIYSLWLSVGRKKWRAVAVFEDGTINGSDETFAYLGSFLDNNGAVFAELTFKRWNQGRNGVVFGKLNTVRVVLRGRLSADLNSFRIAGRSSKLPKEIIGMCGRRMDGAMPLR